MTILAIEQRKEAQLLREELKAEWAELWRNKLRDDVVAEKLSTKEYQRLFVEKGEVIYATRQFKPLSLHEILEKALGAELARSVSPDPNVGGWGRFAKQHFPQAKSRIAPEIKSDPTQQQRKNGIGWLNKNRMWRKTQTRG